jgi:arsenate reductase
MKKTVLFLCTGNAVRSQIAEAIVNARMSDRWQAFSAGVRPAAAVPARVARVLAEIGIPFGGRPKPADEFRDRPLDLVVTLCDEAEEECPVWAGMGLRLHRDYPDPGAAEGTDDEKLSAYRSVRDSMLAELPHLLEAHAR